MHPTLTNWSMMLYSSSKVCPSDFWLNLWHSLALASLPDPCSCNSVWHSCRCGLQLTATELSRIYHPSRLALGYMSLDETQLWVPQCRQGEMLNHAPTTQPIQTLLILNQGGAGYKTEADLSVSSSTGSWYSSNFSNQTTGQSNVPKPSEPNLIISLSFSPRKLTFPITGTTAAAHSGDLYSCQFRTIDPGLSLHTDNSEIERGILDWFRSRSYCTCNLCPGI